MKYRLLKQIIADAVCQRLIDENETEAARKARTRIESWDIQDVATLREIFPYDFPVSLHFGALAHYYDDEGDLAVNLRDLD